MSGHEREEKRAVTALDDECFHDVGRCDAEQRGGFVERSGVHPLNEFDVESPRRSVCRNTFTPAEFCCHAHLSRS